MKSIEYLKYSSTNYLLYQNMELYTADLINSISYKADSLMDLLENKRIIESRYQYNNYGIYFDLIAYFLRVGNENYK